MMPKNTPGTTPADEGIHVHPSINVYIENAGKPEIGGFTIPLPFTKEGLAPWMAAIEADTNNPDSIRVEVGSSVIAPIREAVGLPLDELNYLAAKVNALQPYELEMFLAAIDTGDYGANLGTLINLTENIQKFELQPAFDAVEYGDFLLQCARDSSADAFEKLEQSADVDERYFASHIQRMEDLVDPAAYAQVVIAEEKGKFTEYGYLRLCGDFEEVYHGPADIPVEHRLLGQGESPAMDKEQFWQVIDSAREAAGGWQDTLTEMIGAMEVRENDESFKNVVDLMFDALEEKDPEHFAVRQYRKFKLAAGVRYSA